MHRHAVTIGTFDGLHKGHRSIFKTLLNSRKKTALVFELPPRYYFGKIREKNFLLTTFNERKFILEMWGFNVIKLTSKTLKLNAREFLQYIKSLKPDLITVGKDFKFGKNRTGNTETLKVWCKKNGIELKTLILKFKNEKKLSSGFLRKNVKNFRLLKKFMGFYPVSGWVVKGSGFGRKLGFPTINIKTSPHKLLPDGVFAGYAYIDGGFKKCVFNIGSRPTLKLGFAVEIHMLERFKKTPKFIYAFITEKIRDEMKFNSIAELKERISKDILTAKKQKKFDILKI